MKIKRYKPLDMFWIGINARVAKPIRWLSRFVPYRPAPATREDWEVAYSSRGWDRLEQIDQLARYSVIAGYCSHYFEQGGTVLDVGCGEGILQEKLSPYNYPGYVGIDISAEAIRRTSHRQDEKTVFVKADIRDHNPDQRFDIIIFNESLYYFEDPPGILRRCESFLNENGLFIISMYDNSERNKRIWKMLQAVYTAEDEVRVSHKSGKSWIIQVFRPTGHKG